ncbi:MAG: hypothetical protein GQ474_00590, partial [Sulfurimonas sp.]|nr:hypothetical protein [Sulfurimonas sp.]
MNSTQLYPLTVALKTSAVLDALATENEPLSFDGLASAVAGQEYDVESDCAECCDQNKALVSYLSFLGVKDSTLEDMVMGTEDLSSELVLSLSHAFTAKYDDADMDSLCEEFSQTYTDVDMDDISPTRCKSGYKRKMTIHKGKP